MVFYSASKRARDARASRRSTGGSKRARTSGDHATLLRLKRVVSALRPETKIFYNSGSLTNIVSGSSNVYPLSTIAQGIDITQRIGDKIRYKFVDVMVRATSGVDLDYSTYKYVVVLDKLSNGVVPSASIGTDSIFQDAYPQTSYLSGSQQGRFKILAEKTVSALATYSGNQSSLVRMSCKLDTPATYNASAGSQASMAGKMLYLVLMSDAPGGTADFAWTCQIGFTDA